MMKKKFEFEVAITIVVAVTLLAVWSAKFGSDNPQTGIQRIASLAGRGGLKASPSGSIVFLGDSITAREDWNILFGVSNIVNAGISGNTTDDVLARLDLVLSAKPKKIFLMIGINDLLRGKDVSNVLANYGTILNKIKAESPDTGLYVQSILPMNNDISKQGIADSQKIISLNDQLKALTGKNGAIFIDLYPYFCGLDNKLYVKYAKDGVHPNAYGYLLWKSLIKQYLK